MSADSPLIWSDDGLPRSALYGDVYFSSQDGLAETRTVFLEGCGLPDAWNGRRRFTVGELGFGSGLNILALLDLWRRTAEPAAHLHIFSIEAHPLTADEAARILANWPELADLTKLLVARWPGQARGVHRIDLPELRATLDLAVMDVETALDGWSGQADAWFLDGFSPALNPAMWREEIMALVAQHTAPGGRAATFTVAGAVRRGLQAAGFHVEKRPGHGRKRERLEAHMTSAVVAEPPPPRVAVIGAGIAGASAARALRALGCEPMLVEAEAPGAGASGNPAALVTPRLDAGLGPLAQLFAQGFARAVQLYEAEPAAIIERGVLQLVAGVKDAERFAKIAASDLFEPETLNVLTADMTSDLTGESAAAALEIAQALVVEPAEILQTWGGELRTAQVKRLQATPDGWTLHDQADEVIAQADMVILATGHHTGALWPEPHLGPVRGQASFAVLERRPPATAWGGYVVPTREGVLFGATHDRDDTGSELRQADHIRNLETVAKAFPILGSLLAGAPLGGRAAIRATTADRLPLAGPAPGAPPGLFLLGGFGSRGFSMAPLLAEHVAALALGAPSPLPTPLAALVDPLRFRRRAARRGQDSVSSGA